MNIYAWAAVGGLAGAGLFIGLAILTIGGQRSVLTLIEGADGRLSTSKCQWAAWTLVIVGSYGAIYLARLLTHHPDPLSQVPSNVLIALGFSAATMAAAKGITTGYIAGGRVDKDPPPTAANGTKAAQSGGLLTDDAGITDLSKVQLLTWTVIALLVYLYSLSNQLSLIIEHHKDLGLPDIDGSLMVLTGLSQGGYLGKKLTTFTNTQVILTALLPSTARPREQVSLYGANFGEGAPDRVVTVDGWVLPLNELVMWTDTRIDFLVGAQQPGGGPWPRNQTVAIGVVVKGNPSTTTLALNVVGA